MAPEDFTLAELARSVGRIERDIASMESNLSVIPSHEHRISDLENFKRWVTRASLGGSVGLVFTLGVIIVRAAG